MSLRKKKSDSQPSKYTGNCIAWGGDLHPARVGPHFAVMGQNGSGKTLTIRMLLRSALMPHGKLEHRALIYDPKLDFYPILRGLGIPPDQIHVLNPFDARSEPWHIAAGITTPAASRELAALLLPREKNEHPYFSNTPRAILSELIDTLREKAGADWNLNDLVHLVTNSSFVRVLANGGPRSRAVYESHLKKNARTTRANLISTLHTALVNYETVAALWARSSKPPLRLEQWMNPDEPPSVLLLGTYPEASESLNHINRAVFQRCAQLLRMKPENPTDQTWFILDEVRIAQELSALPELLLASRSKGGRFVLGFQDIHGLHDVYGRDRAEELIAQCHNVAILRLSSPQSIEWASSYFGTDQWWVPTYGESSSLNGGGSSRSYSLQERRNILGSRFRSLRLPSREFGLEGIFATPFARPWHAHLPREFLEGNLATDCGPRGLEPRPAEDQLTSPPSAAIQALVHEHEPDDDTDTGDSPPPDGGLSPSLPF